MLARLAVATSATTASTCASLENLLFGCWEYHGSDFEADMAAIAADPETRRWWTFCSLPAPARFARTGRALGHDGRGVPCRLTFALLRLHLEDDVAVARVAITAGQALGDGLTAREAVPAGHKLALRASPG